jgi:hypothetical protein
MFFVFWLGRTLQMCCCNLFKVSLYCSLCVARSRQGILERCYVVSYSVLQKCVENDGDFVEK